MQIITMNFRIKKTYKPGSVQDYYPCLIIHLGLLLLTGSSDLPGNQKKQAFFVIIILRQSPYLALLRVGFTLPHMSPHVR